MRMTNENDILILILIYTLILILILIYTLIIIVILILIYTLIDILNYFNSILILF